MHTSTDFSQRIKIHTNTYSHPSGSNQQELSLLSPVLHLGESLLVLVLLFFYPAPLDLSLRLLESLKFTGKPSWSPFLNRLQSEEC